MVQWCCVNFQCQGVLLIWIIVGQRLFALELGAGGGCLKIFSNLSQRAVKPKTGGAWMVRRCWINFQCLGVLPIWIRVGQGPIVLAIDAVGLFGHFFPRLSLLFSLSLSLGDGPIYTEILSQRAVKPKTTNQTQNNQQTNGTYIDHDQTMCRTRTATICTRKNALLYIISIKLTLGSLHNSKTVQDIVAKSGTNVKHY